MASGGGRDARAGQPLRRARARAGLEYGPSFQGLTAAWREDGAVYVEASLPDQLAHEAGRFAIHPALLDSALHGVALAQRGEGGTLLPFAWREVAVQAFGAGALRARIDATEGSVALRLVDDAGAPLATVGSLALRALDPGRLQGAGERGERLLGLDWTECALPAPADAPAVEVRRCEVDAELPGHEAARAAAAAALEAMQGFLADEEKADLRLALVTGGAVAVASAESPDPAAAATWGLVRSAISEHPGRFSLIDTDDSEASRAVLEAALAHGEVEPQLALRDGAAFAARLTRLAAADPAEEKKLQSIDPERTVLITGATGVLGALVARHLVDRHGARHLLLLSRSGGEAEGAAELASELKGMGASVAIGACDVSDRAALERAIASIPAERPLGAVVHAAGALADRTIETMRPEQLDEVFAPKVDAAWSLHELTRELDLTAFVLFSSVAGALGAPGQGNYAAASVCLRRARPAPDGGRPTYDLDRLGPLAAAQLDDLGCGRDRGGPDAAGRACPHLRRARLGAVRRRARGGEARPAGDPPRRRRAPRARRSGRAAAALQRPGAGAAAPQRNLWLARRHARRQARDRAAGPRSRPGSRARWPGYSVTPLPRKSTCKDRSETSASTPWRRSSCATA